MPKKPDNAMMLRIIEAVVVLFLGTFLWRIYEQHESNQIAIVELKTKVEALEDQMSEVYIYGFGIDKPSKK